MVLRSDHKLQHLEPISTVSFAGAMVSLVNTITNSITCTIVGSTIETRFCTEYQTITSPNFSAFKALARVITGTKKREHNKHITPVLQKLHWLPVKARITYKIAMIMSKVWQMGLPEAVSIQPATYSQNLRCIGTDLLNVPETKSAPHCPPSLQLC